MTTDRERLDKLATKFATMAEQATNVEAQMRYASTFALLVIARELFDIEGSLDTLAINTPP